MKTTKKETSALDWLAETLEDKTLKPGEYTARSAFDEMTARGIETTLDTVRNILHRRANTGKIFSRPAVIEGRKTTIYWDKP